jgi:hypothetical protein
MPYWTESIHFIRHTKKNIYLSILAARKLHKPERLRIHFTGSAAIASTSKASLNLPPPATRQFNGTQSFRNPQCMYGLRTAVIIANEQLVPYLAAFGYAPTKDTPALFTRATSHSPTLASSR